MTTAQRTQERRDANQARPCRSDDEDHCALDPAEVRALAAFAGIPLVASPAGQGATPDGPHPEQNAT